MKLRTHFFLFLFLFGMAPLLTAVVINLPFVMEQLELFYHKAHVQNLRADFRDLDQYLASRQEVARILAKSMEPDTKSSIYNDEEIDRGAPGYTAWVKQILQDRQDIFQVIYLDNDDKVRFWLERDHDSAELVTTGQSPEIPPPEIREAVRHMKAGAVLVSPIMLHVRTSLSDAKHLMTIHVVSPLMAGAEGERRPAGMVVLNIDVGDMADSYHNTLWVNSNGGYISRCLPGSETKSAFKDFPGLDKIFSDSKLALWAGNGKQMIWVPLFETDKSGPVWVGRGVDPSPVSACEYSTG